MGCGLPFSITLQSPRQNRGTLSRHRELAMLNISRFSSPSISAMGSNCHPRRCSASLLKSALAALVGVGISSVGLTAGEAQALTVTVGGQQWDVTTFTGSYNDNTGKFKTPNNGGVMPWWGQVTVAAAWADALGWALGDPNTGQWDIAENLRSGPAFGWSIGIHPINGDEIIYTQYVFAQPASTYPNYLVSPANMGDLRSRTTITWAQATQPVPGPLPLFGALAAFRASRLLRKRVEAKTTLATK